MSRRDYSKKSHSYKAPRMHIRRDKMKREITKKRAKALFFSIILACFIAVIGYWIFFSSLFMITDFSVRESVSDGKAYGEREIKKHTEVEAFAASYLNERVFFIFPRRNYFFFSGENLKNKLMQTRFDSPVETFDVQTSFPHKAVVAFIRRIPRLTVVTRREIQETVSKDKEGESMANQESVKIVERTYLVDASGIVVAEQDDMHIPLSLPRVVFITSEAFAKYDVILDEPHIAQLLSILDNLQKSSETAPQPLPGVKEVEINESRPDEFVINTEEGYRIYFTLQYPSEKQIIYLKSLLLKIGDRRHEITYIDLRVDNRAYVCCNLEIQ